MEWIKYHEKEKVFELKTKNSTYQMQVREYDTLVHLYYGCPVGDSLITDRIVCVDRGFSGNPYEAGKDKTFSLDTLPQEYTAYGNGDYRINGLEVEQADGSDTANLKFESYEITKGKYFFCLMILNPFHTLYLSFLCCFFVKKHTDPVLYLHSDVLLRPL